MKEAAREPLVLGRYMLCDVIGGGGMAQVHLGKVIGAGGFSRVVAIKRLHPERASDPQISAALIDEARLVSRIRHPNVVPTLDVVELGSELLLVMEYVHGVSLTQLVRIAEIRREPVPLALAARIAVDTLAGLAAAHEAKSEHGQFLELVHRDVSPQNILIDVAGIARVADFGIAKAEGKLAMTRHGQIKGKLNYMSPEQLRGGVGVDRRTDLYATGVVLWELLSGKRLFERQTRDLLHVLDFPADFRIAPPSELRGAEASGLDAVLARALAPSSADRFPDADAMANAIAEAVNPASAKELAAYVRRLAGEALESRDEQIERAEQLSAIHDLPREARPEPEPLAPAPPERTPDTSRLWLFLGGLLAIATLGIVIVVRLLMHRAAIAPVASASAAVTASAAPTASMPDAGSAPIEPSADVANDEPATPSSAPARPRPKPRPRRPDCDPPYSIDARGVRIPRRECLGP